MNKVKLENHDIGVSNIYVDSNHMACHQQMGFSPKSGTSTPGDVDVSEP